MKGKRLPKWTFLKRKIQPYIVYKKHFKAITKVKNQSIKT